MEPTEGAEDEDEDTPLRRNHNAMHVMYIYNLYYFSIQIVGVETDHVICRLATTDGTGYGKLRAAKSRRLYIYFMRIFI